jgi:YVTN family beta-propeller protein
MLYAVHAAVNHINIIDTRTDSTVGAIVVGKTPLLIKIDETTNTGYVTNWESNDVTVIDLNTNQVITNLPTGFVPDQMQIDPDNLRLYVTHHASPHVTVIDLRDKSIETRVQLKGPTHAVALDSKNNLLHVTYRPESGFTGQAFLNRVEFIDTRTNTNIGGFDITNNPFTIAIDSQKQKLFAAVIASGEVIVDDLTKDSRYLDILEKQSSQASQAGGGCLIATAAFGTELASQVQLLREVRDNTLFSTNSGAAFMTGFNQIYYLFSPTVSDWERQNPIFKETIKVFITPMISTLSIMSFADSGSEEQVIGLGISIIALNLGMYVIAPTIAIVKIRSLSRKN